MFASFLQILGAFTLVFLVLMFAGFIWIGLGVRRFFRTLNTAAQQASNPVRVRLIPALAQDWQEKDQAIQQLGFEPIGDFRVDGMPEVRLWAAVHPRGYGAVIYRHQSAGDWFDLVAEWEDGHMVTVSNAPLFDTMDAPPFAQKIAAHELSLGESFDALQQAVTQRPFSKLNPLTSANFPQRFADAYAREMDWRMARGGPTTEEIRRVAAATPSLPSLSDDQFSQADAQIQAQWREKTRDACLDHFLETASIPLKRWEQIREDLVIIHARLDEAAVLELIETWVEVDLLPTLPTSAFADGAEFDALAYFDAINKALPKEQQFQGLGTVDQPVRAAFYIYSGLAD